MDTSEARHLLGVGETATETQIKQAYHRLALIFHPDRGGAQKDFVRLKDAYDTLLSAKTAPRPPTYSAPDAGRKPSGGYSYRVATAAMALMNLNPHDFVQIEYLCHNWLGSVAENNKRAAKQLFWLLFGRIPIGAFVSVLQGQRIKGAANRMLQALGAVHAAGGTGNVGVWVEFADSYFHMLKVGGVKRNERKFNRKEFERSLSRMSASDV